MLPNHQRNRTSFLTVLISLGFYLRWSIVRVYPRGEGGEGRGLARTDCSVPLEHESTAQESMCHPLRSGHPVPQHIRSDWHVVPRHVRVSWEMRNSRAVPSPPFFQVPMESALDVPSGKDSFRLPLGSLIWAFLSPHGWDFSIPLGGAVRLEIEPGKGALPPVRPQATVGGESRSDYPAGSA